MRQSHSRNASSNDKRVGVGVKCPTCMAVHTAVAPTNSKHRHQNVDRTRRLVVGPRPPHNIPFECPPQYQCSHGCQLIFVSAECSICLETVESPVVAFPCGHVVCETHFRTLGGRIGVPVQQQSTRTHSEIRQIGSNRARASRRRRRTRTLSEFLDANRARQSTSALPGLSSNHDSSVNLTTEEIVEEEEVIENSDNSNSFGCVDDCSDNVEVRAMHSRQRQGSGNE
mmetsp:Transcript_21895/g.54106  ORF Transcript_21895/g.54106 Transcript_21895/m.54106 type:complete len:227 (+) Transcript_21895:42-722(+)